LKAEAEALVEEMEPGDIQFDDESGEVDRHVDRERDSRSRPGTAAVEEIDHTLAKLDNGAYGICENCGVSSSRHARGSSLCRCASTARAGAVETLNAAGEDRPGVTGQRHGRGGRRARRIRVMLVVAIGVVTRQVQVVGGLTALLGTRPPDRAVRSRVSYNTGVAFSIGQLRAHHRDRRGRRRHACVVRRTVPNTVQPSV